MANTLIISPHCDDEVLGCGGIIAKRQSVFVFYIGVEKQHIVNQEERRKEVQNVSEYLKFDYVIGNKAPNFYYASKKEIIDQIEEVINKIKPEEIFIPSNKSYNQDHQVIYDCCLVALRPHDINHFVPKVFVYEVDQYLTWPASKFTPVYFEKINIGIKVNAYKLHKSQIRDMRPPELIETVAKLRGFSCGHNYAEGFEVERYVV